MNTRRHPPANGRLRLRPTRLGLWLATTVLLLWLVGLNYQVNLAYLTAFWLAGFLAVAVLLNCLQLIGLRLHIEPPAELFQGETAEITIYPAANSRTRRRQIWIAAADCDGNAAETYRPAVFGRTENTDKTFVWPFCPHKRGRLELPPLLCSTVFPFGISNVECLVRPNTDRLVYPAPLPHTPPSGNGSGSQGSPAPNPHGSEDLSHLQEHRTGTPLQHIAWKSYAKTGRLLDKRFDEPRHTAAPDTISHTDYPADTPPDRLAGLLCYRILDAERQGRPYTLVLPQQTFQPQTGQREKCLRALALL